MVSALDPNEFREMLVEDGEEMLKEGHLDLLIRLKKDEESGKQLGRDIASLYPDIGEMVERTDPARPVVELLYRSDRERSMRAYFKANDQMLDFREQRVKQLLADNDVDIGVKLVAEDISTPQERAARQWL